MATDSMQSMAGQMLIAMPSLQDSWFAKSVTLLCEHDAQGALGLTINQSLKTTVAEMFEQLKLPVPVNNANAKLLSGGPVQMERGFVIHSEAGNWDSSLVVNEALFVTSSHDIINAIAENKGPSDYLIALGYSGWEGGQLEAELADNAWMTAAVDNDILFHSPVEEKLDLFTAAAGIDWSSISSVIGHG